MKIKILQAKLKNKNGSFWYDGDIAEMKYKNKIVIVSAAGDIRIHNKTGELVHDGKTRNSGFPEFKNLEPKTDKDLSKLEKLEYRWENNNWFEVFYGYEGENLDCILGNVVFTYDEAIEMGKSILSSKFNKHLWKRT